MASLTNTEITAARLRGRQRAANEPHAVSARYDARTDRIIVELADGLGIALPRHKLQGLRDATPQQLKRVQVLPPGTAIVWDEPDVGFTVTSLASGIFGTKEWMAALGRAGGAVKSERKAAASRANGALGGRPRKQTGDATKLVADAAILESMSAGRTWKSSSAGGVRKKAGAGGMRKATAGRRTSVKSKGRRRTRR
ncbi:MAG: DUF2442 domain-containing protein [Candidatus Eremiobacteraeota bacterium]|nr:DUF2442 domain-containing protein [Candidatus Eremiobacteraeota bacterium]MBC5802486.1 DUF2442 domain-containing protein [Candidatus Eremiobacteraeota bacterium]MBC5821588.1 DUF2442 domain-containing protein [Candidatus Eremiobacteraeota bacterium]